MKNQKINIETKRLFLRPLIESDAVQTYADWLNDSDVNRYLETRHEVQTIESCRTFIQHCNQDSFSHLFGIFLKDSGGHIGNAKLGNLNPHHARAELSMFIGDKSCWGKGLATEVVHALTAYGFDDLGQERIQAGCYEKKFAIITSIPEYRLHSGGFLSPPCDRQQPSRGLLLARHTEA